MEVLETLPELIHTCIPAENLKYIIYKKYIKPHQAIARVSEHSDIVLYLQEAKAKPAFRCYEALKRSPRLSYLIIRSSYLKASTHRYAPLTGKSNS